MKKRKWMLGSSLLLVALLIAGGTMAWFTATADPVVNNFKAGNMDIELIDIFNKDAAQNINPGDCIDKIVKVKNTGSKRAMVRVKFDAVFSNPELDISVVDAKFNDEKWAYNFDDSYFYYKEVLQPGDETMSLFKDDKVCFKGKEMGNEYQGVSLDITVKADAVQATNGAPTAEGWMFDPLKPE